MYLIIGASGFFGAYFLKNILKKQAEIILASSRSKTKPNAKNIHWLDLNLEDDSSIHKFLVEVNSYKVDKKVIYLSAYHHPDKVLENPAYARKINIIGLTKILIGLKYVEGFYYSSTDSIYGESYNNYQFTESDSGKPENEYGSQKAEAEALVLKAGYSVARYSFLVGKSLIEKKHFFDQIVFALQENQKIDLLEDSFRSALDFEQAASFTIQLLDNSRSGIFNICGDQNLSKFDVGMMIARKFQFDEGLIQKIKFKDASFFKAARAQNCLMSNQKLKKTLTLDSIMLNL